MALWERTSVTPANRLIRWALSLALCACAHPHASTNKIVPRVHAATPAPKPLTAAQQHHLRTVVDAIFPSDGAQSFCIIDDRGIPVYERNASFAVAPASAQKLIVAATALADLGPAYKFVTSIAARESPQDGILNGDLWLIGSADPVLVSNDLRGGVKILQAEGLKEVRGGVRVDATFLSGPERNPQWEASDAQYGFSAATSAISLDQDTIEVHVTPTSEGLAAHVWLEPPSNLITLRGDVLTVSPGLQTTIAVNPQNEPNHFSIGGQIAADDRKAILYVPIRGVPLYVADVLTRMLQQRQISVAKPPSVGVARHGMRPMWQHRSMPLERIIAKMLFESNNHLAEQLLRTIGRAVNGVGSDRAGVAAERSFLRRYDVPRPGLNLVDGSGLSVTNRSSALTLATLLDDDRRLRGARIYDALPRVGVEGTVKYYRLGAARGRVRAKSGHLAGVESLAGYIATQHSGTFAFAFLFENDDGSDVVDGRIARAVERLAEF